jgi:hypothetical protein
MGMGFLAPNFCGSGGRRGGGYEDEEEYKKSNIYNVQKIKTRATNPKEIAILTLQVKVFFLHVFYGAHSKGLFIRHFVQQRHCSVMFFLTVHFDLHLYV